MPRQPRAVPALGDRPFRGSTAVADGLLTANELRGPAWRRIHRDVHVAAGVPVTQLVRARAAQLVLPGAVVSGRSAAWLWGVDVDGPDGAAGTSHVEVTVPPGAHRLVPGIRVRRRVLDPGWVWCVPTSRDVPTLWAEHAALELAADTSRGHVEAVVVLDQFCESAPVTLARLRAAGAGWTGRGRVQLTRALAAADGLAGSPPETRLRLGLHAADLPQPHAQFRLVTPTGRRVKTLDFAWPHLRFAVEYDGWTHVATSTRVEAGFHLPKDRRVLNEAQALGWRIHYVTAPDGHDMAGLVTGIGAALHSRAAELGVPLS
ncbi:MAG: hypothetical protein JWQ53_1710 [Klenkia sp.]|nr:hypothetical protein [Klenkia sp.]